MDHPCVTESIEGEIGTNRMGKQRTSVNVADKIIAAHRGERASIFSPQGAVVGLRSEEPQAVKAHVFIIHVPCYTYYCSYLEPTTPVAASGECRSPVIPHRMSIACYVLYQ